MKKHIIWGNIDLNIDDWRDEYAEYCEINGIDPGNDDEIYNYMYETNNYYLDDERENLNKTIDGDILIIGDLGLWRGRVTGYKIINSRNLRDILYFDDDLIEVYGDGREIRARGIHHDGTNNYLFRAIRAGRNIDNLLDAIYNGETITAAKLNYYTRSIYSDIANIYGWRK